MTFAMYEGEDLNYSIIINQNTCNMRSLLLMLCFTPFYLVSQTYYDCPLALPICDDSQIIIKSLQGGGHNEIIESKCFPSENAETNSAWLWIKTKANGSISFTIEPINLHDDIDFIVFKNLESACDNLNEVRCMASGKNLGSINTDYLRCLGATGLKDESKDEIETKGCFGHDDNFGASVLAKSGNSYHVLVNNYSSNRGFKFTYTGSAELDNSLEAEKIIAVENVPGLSQYRVYSIDEAFAGNYTPAIWSFGQNANPSSAVGNGPHIVKYSTEGLKEISIDTKNEFGCEIKLYKSESIKVDEASATNEGISIGLPFPNPTSNEVFISVGVDASTDLNFDLLDVEGRIIKSFERKVEKAQTQEFDLSDIPTSVYVLAIRKDNQLIETFPITKTNK